MLVRRVYCSDTNVYEAAVSRLRFVFDRFRRVYVSFSGGKDSGALLHLAIQCLREHYPGRKLGVMILDNEANYEYSVEFMRRVIENNLDVLDVYWCCLPITLPCTVSAYTVDWQCWGESDKDRWVRPRPTDDYVVTADNHPFGDLFVENMTYDAFWDMFGEWFSQGVETANLIGIRADESLNRFRAIVNMRTEQCDGRVWTRRNAPHVFNCYPIYDWRTLDVWTANARQEWDYNRLYDVFYKAGVPVSRMRVASPFMSESKSSLSLYRVIDPHIWARLCARVQGANFVATYGKQLSYRSVSLPEGHTWRSFVKFLLSTLPEETASNFRKRFVQSIKFWGRVGRGVREETIAQLEQAGIDFTINGTTPHGSKTLRRVRIRRPPDHLDMIRVHPAEVTSWKRFALTILKNDHTCKYLGLQPTIEQQQRQREISRKYRNV